MAIGRREEDAWLRGTITIRGIARGRGMGDMIEIELRYFAMIREIIGRSKERRSVEEKTTPDAVFDVLIREHPRLANLKPVVLPMVNKAYVSIEHELRDGDEVAFIPPVSGGETKRFRVQAEKLDAREIESLVAHGGAGAIATFTGTVRNHGRGKDVHTLEYEAYAPAAELSLAQIGDEIRERWGLDHVAISHRTGHLAIGEASVVISVASPHRDAAFEACRYAIERIKEIVPIWKKEHYADGASWLGSERDYQVETGRLRGEEPG